jgi:hypothetical protein
MVDADPTADTERPPPLYEHDCPLCTFLGSVEYLDRHYDLYFCRQGHLEPTVIARHGSEPAHYSSGLELAFVDVVLHEAVIRARVAGLLPIDFFEHGKI